MITLRENFTVTAHTGCMNTEVNTIESIEKGFDAGADIAEIDIRFDSAGEPILTHNTLSLDEEKSAVKLSEAFDFIRQYPDKKVNLDIKETKNLIRIQSLAYEKDVIKQIFFTGVEEAFVDAVRKSCPDISYYLNCRIPNIFSFTSLYIDKWLKKTAAAGAVGINLTKSNCSKKLIRAFHKKKMLVSVWTITDEKTAVKYLKMQPDNITCKNPHEVIKLKGKY